MIQIRMVGPIQTLDGMSRMVLMHLRMTLLNGETEILTAMETTSSAINRTIAQIAEVTQLLIDTVASIQMAIPIPMLTLEG